MGIEVLETNLTEPFISRSLITLQWEEEERAVSLQDYDSTRTPMNKEGKETFGADGDHPRSDQPKAIAQSENRVKE